MIRSIFVVILALLVTGLNAQSVPTILKIDESITNYSFTPAIYSAYRIYGTNVIEAGVEVEFKAERSVHLTNGFHSQKGSSFHASIETSEVSSQKNITVSPNPTNGVIRLASVTSFSGKYSLEVYSILGSLLYSEDIVTQDLPFDKLVNLSSLSDGTYVIQLNSFDDGQLIHSSQIVKF